MFANQNTVEETKKKYAVLLERLTELESVAVAFSGGVDSTFLLNAARDALGDKAVAFTVAADFIPKRELTAAKEFCREKKIRQVVCHCEIADVPNFRENPPERCYWCKRKLLTQIISKAREMKLYHVIEGSNADDESDYRPGKRAIAELNVLSPLRAAGLSKSDIRILSREKGLSVWNKPSSACLASRIPYGEEITPTKLDMVERAEDFLLTFGFCQVRVRAHGDLARLEIPPADFAKLFQSELKNEVVCRLKELGFSYVTLDLQGYRIGSMNEVLKQTASNRYTLSEKI